LPPSTGLAPAPPALPPPTGLGSYRIVYAISDLVGPGPEIHTEVLAVRRPFDERLEDRAGPPPGGEIRGGRVENRDLFWNLTEGGQPQFGVRRRPALQTHGVSSEVLTEAVRDGRAKRLGNRVVLGHPCTVFSYFAARPFALSPPTRVEHLDDCVSSDGVLLREEWTLQGRTVRVTEAVDLDTSPQFSADTFFIGRQPDTSSQAAALISREQAVLEGQVPKGAVLRPRLPPGFALDRQATVLTSGSGGPGSQSFIESFVRGAQAAVVERGVTGGRDPPWHTEEGDVTRVGGFDQARLVFFVDEVEVRAWQTSHGAGGVSSTRYVRIAAPYTDMALYMASTLAVQK